MTIETNILISISSGTIGGSLCYYILKTFLVQKIKNQIQFEYEIRFENARKELEKKATEHQIKYSKLHIDRTSSLKEIYEKLIDNETALELLVLINQDSEGKSNNEKEKNAIAQYDELIKIIRKRRIYFSQNLCLKLDSLVAEYKSVIMNMTAARKIAITEIEEGEDRSSITSLKMLFTQRSIVADKLSKTREIIEEEFRQLIGV